MSTKKYWIYAVAMAILIGLTSCAPQRAIDNRFPCAKNATDALSGVEKIMVDEGLQLRSKAEGAQGITHYTYSTGDINNGMVNVNYLWEVWFADQKIHTIPMIMSQGYVWIGDDNTNAAHTYYWNIRAKLEKMCSCKALVTIYQPSESMKEQSLGR